MDLKFSVYSYYINKCKTRLSLLTDTVGDCAPNIKLVSCNFLTTQYCIDDIL